MTEPGDVWQNVLDLQATMGRLREEHGPFLRELRCDATVLRYLTLRVPPSERKPWEPPPLLGIPVIEDDDVPARHLRRVYDDGTTEDVEVISEPLQLIVRDGLITRSANYPPLGGPGV